MASSIGAFGFGLSQLLFLYIVVKCITSGQSYEIAMNRARRVLSEFRIRGVKTNIPFLQNVLANPIFIEGLCTTRFIDDTPELRQSQVHGKGHHGEVAGRRDWAVEDLFRRRQRRRPVADRDLPEDTCRCPTPGRRQERLRARLTLRTPSGISPPAHHPAPGITLSSCARPSRQIVPAGTIYRETAAPKAPSWRLLLPPKELPNRSCGSRHGRAWMSI